MTSATAILIGMLCGATFGLLYAIFTKDKVHERQKRKDASALRYRGLKKVQLH